MQMKMSFMVLETWLFGFGKVLDKFWKFFIGVCTKPDNHNYLVKKL